MFFFTIKLFVAYQSKFDFVKPLIQSNSSLLQKYKNNNYVVGKFKTN